MAAAGVSHPAPFTGIDQDIKLNKALWLLGAEKARLKGAH
ncbi:hypothetical protein J2861_004650 [Agrobacterium tumefaciens]|nr:hypothetical protein [Agrobacterium tumefaciens]MBP2573898.1 hypothetical protein [Agrobacterium tumefaciens]MDP9790635.1 hypothetical protein [Agrobacterium tumefaciens]MDP9857653.1 hypothetical protein [Agrobacterium tumefaciens]